MQQRTITKPVEAVGIGLHKGEPIRLRLEPLSENSGIIFYREDIGLTIPLAPESVVNTQMATVIGGERGSISTIEHFLSSVYAYGIDNLRVIVDGNEMPIMDGSAISFCLLLDEAGIEIQNAPKNIMRILEPIEVRDGDKFVKFSPSDNASFDFTIHFDHPAIGKQSHKFMLSTKSFVDEIARARTFGFAHEIQYLQSQNLALGATLQNAIGLDEHKILNPEGLRFDNEFARHKILDAMGDMMVGGVSILGSYESFAGSHKLNAMLVSKLKENPQSYEIVAIDALKSREFEKSFAKV